MNTVWPIILILVIATSGWIIVMLYLLWLFQQDATNRPDSRMVCRRSGSQRISRYR